MKFTNCIVVIVLDDVRRQVEGVGFKSACHHTLYINNGVIQTCPTTFLKDKYSCAYNPEANENQASGKATKNIDAANQAKCTNYSCQKIILLQIRANIV